MIKFGPVLDYRTANKAVIGKKYVYSNYLKDIAEIKEISDELISPLEDIVMTSRPFKYCGCYWQFCREVIEEEVRMTNRQLAEWLAKRNGERTYQIEGFSGCFVYWAYLKGEENKTVPKSVVIRSWGSNEWVVPTLEIYERDCKG